MKTANTLYWTRPCQGPPCHMHTWLASGGQRCIRRTASPRLWGALAIQGVSPREPVRNVSTVCGEDSSPVNIKVKRLPQVSSARQQRESASPPPWEDALLPQPVLRCEIRSFQRLLGGCPLRGAAPVFLEEVTEFYRVTRQVDLKGRRE